MKYAHSAVSYIAANDNGRDFAVGDIHGEFNQLKNLLDHVNFDCQLDRLFSVGDIIDRGPDSMECLALLEKPWFHCVIGNHEQQFVSTMERLSNFVSSGLNADEAVKQLTKGVSDAFLDRWGARWYFDALKNSCGRCYDSFQAIATRLSKLPNIIVVGKDKNRWQVVHAQVFHKNFGRLPDSEIDYLKESVGSATSAHEQFRAHCYVETITNAGTWGFDVFDWWLQKWLDSEEIKSGIELSSDSGKSSFIKMFSNQDLLSPPGCSLTLCGHTTIDQPDLTLGHLFIDTCEGDRGITLVQLPATDAETRYDDCLFFTTISGQINEFRMSQNNLGVGIWGKISQIKRHGV